MRTYLYIYMSMYVVIIFLMALFVQCCWILQDTKEEYLKLLSLLDSQSDLNNSALITSANGNISKLKERLSSHIAYKSKLDYSRFLEYWVPAQLSNVQIELYCATLLSNSMALRSFSKIGSVEAIRDILTSSRKVSLI